jgi:ubiquinone/menaquinone biosynthesis C-methylase UbiE
MDPKRFYDSVSPQKFGPDYEKARWDSSPMARAQYLMAADAMRRFALPGLERARSIIELGPGPGTWTKLLMEKNPGAAYTLVDISKTMLDQARAALPGARVSFIESDWLALKAEKPADYFFSSRAIEYVSDKAEAARVVQRSLAPSGFGVIITKMPKPLFDALRGRGVTLHGGQIGPAALGRLLANAGLRVTGTTIFSATFPLLGSAALNRGLYALLKHLPLVFPFELFAESYAIRFKKP